MYPRAPTGFFPEWAMRGLKDGSPSGVHGQSPSGGWGQAPKADIFSK